MRADYGVSYIELGLALTAFNVVTALGQTRRATWSTGSVPRVLLICGLLLGALAFALAGLVDSFWFFVAMFAPRRPRQHGLSPGRLRHALPPRSRRSGSAAPFRSIPSRDAGLDRGAGQPPADAKPMGLARRLHRRGAAWLVVAIRSDSSSSEPEQRVAVKPKSDESGPGRLAPAGSARRSCSTCSCSHCSRW